MIKKNDYSNYVKAYLEAKKKLEREQGRRNIELNSTKYDMLNPKELLIPPIDTIDYKLFLNHLSDKGICLSTTLKEEGKEGYIKLVNIEYKKWLLN